MVLTCAYPDCSNRLKTKRLRSLARTHSGLVTFHVFPTSEPARLKLWLIALRLDINTPINVLKLLRVCSNHFSPDDFTYPGEDHIQLKPSIFPTSEPARLKLWLIALRLDINTPINVLKLLRFCSNHFSPDDFTYSGEDHIRLKPSAVPMVFPHPTEVCEQDLCMCPFYL
uniref:THAP domain-containing protein 1 n=1 Tax=Sinocyclocheilus grahami TaxID=75366 RepID=A0A672NSA7_SINGR